jgi:hypothetical protein
MVKANQIASLNASQKNTAKSAIQSAMEAVSDAAASRRISVSACAARPFGLAVDSEM